MLKSGTPYPIHVQKSILGQDTQSLFCESQGCDYLQTVAGVSNQTSYECAHLQSIQYITRSPELPVLCDETLDNLIEGKRLKPETKKLSKELKYRAESLGNTFVAAWDHEKYVFISVYVGEVHHYSRSERVVLLFNKASFDISCRCSHSTQKGCLHTAAAKWYLYETMPHVFENSGVIKEKGTLENSSTVTGSWCTKVTDYLMDHFRLPYEIPDYC